MTISATATPPAASAAKLRPLLPKVPVQTGRPYRKRLIPRSVSRPHIQLRCHVCLKQSCNLSTHKAHGKPQSEASHEPHELMLYTSSYSYEYAKMFIENSAAIGTADYFLPLPLLERIIEMDKLELNLLFLDFFVLANRQILMVPLPSELSTEICLSPLFLPAISDTAVCLAVLAVSAAARAVRKDQPVNSVPILALIDAATRQLLTQLNEREPDDNRRNDNTIIAATLLWAINSLLEDLSAMEHHSRTVYALVTRQGGLKKLGLAGAVMRLVKSADLCQSLLFAQEPRYKLRNESLSVFQPKTLQYVYGEAFCKRLQAEDKNLDPAVSVLSLDSCRIIEILEVMLSDAPSIAEYLHCLSTLSDLGTQSAVLCAKYGGTFSINECVCITTQLVILLTFYAPHEQRLLQTTLGERAIRAAQRLFMLTDWEQNIDLFIWILSVLVMLPHEYKDKKLALDLLHRALCIKFDGEEWSDDWEARLFIILKQFVWSGLRLTDSFVKVCQAARSHIAPMQSNPPTKEL